MTGATFATPPAPLAARLGAYQKERFFAGAFTALVFFAWLRILDEHKDAEIDRRYRPELPVPRGLVSRAELRRTGLLMLAAALRREPKLPSG